MCVLSSISKGDRLMGQKQRSVRMLFDPCDCLIKHGAGFVIKPARTATDGPVRFVRIEASECQAAPAAAVAGVASRGSRAMYRRTAAAVSGPP